MMMNYAAAIKINQPTNFVFTLNANPLPQSNGFDYEKPTTPFTANQNTLYSQSITLFDDSEIDNELHFYNGHPQICDKKVLMNVTIPVLVTEYKKPNSSVTMQNVRPLFYPQPAEEAESLQRALNKLAGTLRNQIEKLGKEARHDEIAKMCFSPVIAAKRLDFRLNFGAENFDCRYLFARFSAFNKRLAFTPNVPDVWFEVERGENWELRAVEVLDDYFRRLERRDGRGSQNPTRFNYEGKAWLTSVDFNVYLPQKFEKKEPNLFAFLGMSDKMNGAEELRKTGRNLDWLYPDALERTTGRGKEIEKLTEFLNSKDKRPVLIVGKTAVGKTALVHEYVYRTVSKRSNPRHPDKNTWLLAPQRLISGMMYVGQWEERLLAIIKEAQEREHLLYFEDLLGLFFAGQSRDSDLSMAHVLKPYIERREIRILGEITPEAFRILQERDRSFADLFQILRLEETNKDETLRIVLSVRRELEQRYKCEFAIDALPVALDLQRRYVRESAFPGKAANFLRQLAIKFSGKEIKRDDVLREFEAKSGMSVALLDDKTKLDRTEVVEKITAGVIGQAAAVEAAADVISIAKARLNDTNRPLASFLFLGATGVGKTEAAKQIAAYLYGDEEKLLRFDMNEYVSPYDAARLAGTIDQPEGLLTSAIRRQPFSVVLLDEIEKAHPDVFNLLLQVMGDGRLTDALGRTADFTNAILILTSNLGAREANVKLGFRQTNETEAHVYRQTAEKFFKPEFFNRFDRVIGFERLRRTDVEKIAEKQLNKVFQRDGLVRRNSKLNVTPDALRLIVNEGYHPQLGARALKRAIEKYLTQPVASRLAALSPDAPTVIHIAAENKKIAARVEEIKPTAAIERSVWLTKNFTDVDAELDLITDALDRIEDEIAPLKPKGEVSAHDPRQANYFLVRDQIKRIERMIERAEKWAERETQEVQSPKSKVQKFKTQADKFARRRR
jgi:ATP-dependent Clp protease ATP-binding subunit ClpC